TDRRPGGCPAYPRPRTARRRVLRRQLHGTAPHRSRHRPTGRRVRGAEIAPGRTGVSRFEAAECNGPAGDAVSASHDERRATGAVLARIRVQFADSTDVLTAVGRILGGDGLEY